MMVAAEKCANVMGEMLCHRGWVPVGNRPFAVFMKNGCFFVVGQKHLPSSQLSEQATSGAAVIVQLMVHTDNKSWHVEKDGFMLLKGKINRAILQAYDYGIDSSYGEKLLPIIEEIDSFAGMDNEELLAVKRYAVLPRGSEMIRKIVPSSKGVNVTRKFIVNPDKHHPLTSILQHGIVYFIDSMKGDSMRLVPFSDDLSGIEESRACTIPFSQITEAADKGCFLAVDIVQGADTGQLAYKKFIPGKCRKLSPEFDVFNLSVAQATLVAEIMLDGFNFTPLLGRGNIRQLELIAELIKSGVNCRCLVGKNIPVENLEFLVNLSKSKIPLDVFSEEEETIGHLKMKYSGLSETIEERLSQYSMPEAVRSVARNIAFTMRDFSHVTKASCAVEAMLLDEAIAGRFSDLAKLVLAEGILQSGCMKLSWACLDSVKRDIVLSCFKCAGVRFMNDDWNYFIESKRESVNALFYLPDKGFVLSVLNRLIWSDYNSLVISGSDGTTVWRAVQVNGNFFHYDSGDVL